MAADITQVRIAIRKILIEDATLLGLLNGEPRVFYLRVRRAADIPSVTFADIGDRPDIQTPYQVRTLTFDIWHNNFEDAEAIATRIRTLLDKREVPIPSGDFLVNIIWYESDREGPLEEGDLVQKTVEFRFSMYDLTQTV